MSLFPVKKLPRELKDIIYSYCQADVQFARIDLSYPKLTLYRCIQDICEADTLYVRMIIHEIIKQHWIYKKRVRSMTL